MIRHFIVFESNKQEDANGLITIKTIKKMAAYHQYYAVNAAVLYYSCVCSELGLEVCRSRNATSRQK
jgi:hypothetical protein